MHRSTILLALGLCGFLSARSLAQVNSNASLCIDATNERRVHFVSDVTAQNECDEKKGGGDLASQFLVQGGRSQFRVINRKFLSDYSFTIDGSTQVLSERIQGLEEASTLTTPLSSGAAAAVSKGAAPKGLSTSGTLTLRTAQQLLSELTDPTTSSNPANELESDWVIVNEEIKRLNADKEGFDGLWVPLLGQPAASRELDCQNAYGNPNFVPTENCLALRYRQETSGIWQDAKNPVTGKAEPFSDEDAFRQLIVTDTDVITMVTALQSKLTAQVPLSLTQLSSLDGDLAQFSADINTLQGNLKASEDAAELAQNLPETLQLAEIKQRLLTVFNNNKQTVDPGELNILSQELLIAARSRETQELLRDDAHRLQQEVARIRDNFRMAAPPYSASRCDPAACIASLEESFRKDLVADTKAITLELPARIDTINSLQSRLLERTNLIYDNSAVDVPLDKVITLGGLKGNLFVYYTIRRIDAFTRFQIPAVTVQGVVPGNSASSLPPTPTPASSSTTSGSASGSSSTSTTTTTTATSTTTTTVITPASASSTTATTGTVVAHGEIAIHDVYRSTVVAAFAFSTVKESPQTVTVSSGNSNGPQVPSAPCTTVSPCSQVRSGPIHTSAIMGLMVHFGYFDTFPHAPNRLRSRLGFFGGLSVQNVNDYYTGLAFEPINGVQIMGGGNFYRQSQLAPGFTLNDVYPGSPTFTGRDGWSSGGYFGLALNLRIFRKVFGSVTGVGTSPTSSGGSGNGSGSSPGSN